MTTDHHSTFRSLCLKAAGVGVVVALHVAAFQPALGAQARGEHSVRAWATALMDRPVARSRAGRGGGGGGQGQAAAGQPAQAPPVTAFNDQTARQIVRVTLGGQRVRVVLSNAFGTSAAQDWCSARRPARQEPPPSSPPSGAGRSRSDGAAVRRHPRSRCFARRAIQ